MRTSDQPPTDPDQRDREHDLHEQPHAERGQDAAFVTSLYRVWSSREVDTEPATRDRMSSKPCFEEAR